MKVYRITFTIQRLYCKPDMKEIQEDYNTLDEAVARYNQIFTWLTADNPKQFAEYVKFISKFVSYDQLSSLDKLEIVERLDPLYTITFLGCEKPESNSPQINKPYTFIEGYKEAAIIFLKDLINAIANPDTIESKAFTRNFNFESLPPQQPVIKVGFTSDENDV